MPPHATVPYATPLTFRTQVRPTLYLASAGLFVLGLMFVGYSVWGPEGQAVMAALISGVGVFILYIAWVNFWATRAGYPHLTMIGHRLTVQSSDAVRRDLDLSALGDTEVKILTGSKGSQRLYLAFLPAPGTTHKPRRFTAPKLQPYAETILLNGYVGSNVMRAKEIERVINARRVEPRQPIALPSRPDPTFARIRLAATSGVFAALWVALVWWRLLP